MTFRVAPLLIHSDYVPASARGALKAAYAAPPERRDALLESAARVLHEETDLGCDDVREIFGFPQEGDCD